MLHSRFDYKNARYVATHEDYHDFMAYSNNNMILGTHSWSIINDSKVWEENILKIVHKKFLAMSKF